MKAFQIQFKDSESSSVERVLDFVRSLDFVQSVKELPNQTHLTKRGENGKNSQPDDFLPVQEIKRRHPNEWVLLDHVMKNGLEITGGAVLLHHPDKRTFALQAQEIVREKTDRRQMFHFFTGELPKHARIGVLRKMK